MSDDESSGNYTGPERRKGERRVTPDRRKTVRWEPDKPDRRSGKDRRKTNRDIWEYEH